MKRCEARVGGVSALVMDRLTPERRSWNMSRIRGRDTMPEKRVRSILHRLGFRFSLRRTDLLGKPDIVLPARHAVVFVHGCFWHRHEGCSNATTPSTRRSFWEEKLTRNVKRDAEVSAALTAAGWKVIRVWECEIDDETALAQRLQQALGVKKEMGFSLGQ